MAWNGEKNGRSTPDQRMDIVKKWPKRFKPGNYHILMVQSTIEVYPNGEWKSEKEKRFQHGYYQLNWFWHKCFKIRPSLKYGVY